MWNKNKSYFSINYNFLGNTNAIKSLKMRINVILSFKKNVMY